VYVGSSYMYSEYDDMKGALARVNRDIISGGLPRELCPMVFAVTGTGRVS